MPLVGARNPWEKGGGNYDLDLPENPPYMKRALCKDIFDPEVFFPMREDSPTAEEARKWCAVCPVAVECLLYAIDNEIYDGVWGGMMPEERRTFSLQLRV